jgi:hypothetical protein
MQQIHVRWRSDGAEHNRFWDWDPATAIILSRMGANIVYGSAHKHFLHSYGGHFIFLYFSLKKNYLLCAL